MDETIFRLDTYLCTKTALQITNSACWSSKTVGFEFSCKCTLILKYTALPATNAIFPRIILLHFVWPVCGIRSKIRSLPASIFDMYLLLRSHLSSYKCLSKVVVAVVVALLLLPPPLKHNLLCYHFYRSSRLNRHANIWPSDGFTLGQCEPSKLAGFIVPLVVSTLFDGTLQEPRL